MLYGFCAHFRKRLILATFSLNSKLVTSAIQSKSHVASPCSLREEASKSPDKRSDNISDVLQPKLKYQSKSDYQLYNQWTSLKNINHQVAVLLNQTLPESDLSCLFPRQMSILPACEYFWQKKFSHNFNSSPEIVAAFKTGSPIILSQTLLKILILNTHLQNFGHVSVASGEFAQFLRVCDMLRSKSKTRRGLVYGKMLASPDIYVPLMRYFASKGEWENLSGILKRYEQDGLLMPPTAYFYCFECLGRLLSRTESSSNPLLMLQSLALDSSFEALLEKSRSYSDKSTKVIIDNLERLVAEAESRGFALQDLLFNSPRASDTLAHVLTGLKQIRPDFCETMISHSSIHEINAQQHVRHPVERYLESIPHRMYNSFAQAIPQTADLMESFEQQLQLERAGEVRIPPVLPPFPRSYNPAKAESEKPAVTTQLSQQLRKSLMEEQSRWRSSLLIYFEELLQQLKKNHSRNRITVYPFLKILPAKQYVDIMVKIIDTIALDSALQHTSSHITFYKIGQMVEQACRVYRLEKLGALDELREVYKLYATQFNSPTMKWPQFRQMWNDALHQRLREGGVSLNQDWPQWTTSMQLAVGRVLYDILYNRLTFDRRKPLSVRRNRVHPSEPTPILFEVLTEFDTHVRNELRLHPTLANWYRDADYPPLSFHPAELPMLCPPIPWVNLQDAGYLLARNYSTRLIRSQSTLGSVKCALEDDLDFDPKRIPSVLDSLNCLAACPWKVNEPILDDLISVAKSGGNKQLSMPELRSAVAPAPLAITQSMNFKVRKEVHRTMRELRKKFDETRSLWSSELYRLSIANQFRGRVFWFPHSMDFRGRVYPCPPHFHHMGCDVARGLIVFAKGLPLGKNGLDWLKIHLINLTGLKKRCSNAERLAYANSILDDVVDSAQNPFTGRGWWQEQEEPWQTLACCRELAAALSHDAGPESYVSAFPVHQDGSCNGLQHYAALGRDQRGAESVNLTDREFPEDVYADVVDVVEAQRRADAAAGNRVAQVLEGFVRRKVIKQSVMTTVYGVTFYGATEQIRRQLRDLDDFPDPKWIIPASSYLAKATLSSIGKIFTSSTNIQNWFGKIASHISRHFGLRVAWETPLGLPVTQPYMKSSSSTFSLFNTDHFLPSGQSFPVDSQPLLGISALDLAQITTSHSAKYLDIPVPDPVKQRNAFPPNFIHSLDSCHMMLTALHCLREGVTFASVHDCFWTHAGTVDQMNRICREEFIALHSEPILQNFSDYLRQKFAYTESEIANMTSDSKRAKAMAFNQLLNHVPKPGSFDLNEIRNSTYFFS